MQIYSNSPLMINTWLPFSISINQLHKCPGSHIINCRIGSFLLRNNVLNQTHFKNSKKANTHEGPTWILI